MLLTVVVCLGLLVSDNLGNLESDPAKLYYVIYLGLVALLAELTERQPNLSVGVLVVFLVNLVRMVHPKKVVFLVD